MDLKELGIPSVEEVVAEYCQKIGIAPIHNWDWYVAFGLFRMAAIIQGVYMRSLQGKWLLDFTGSQPLSKVYTRDPFKVSGFELKTKM